MSPPSHIPVPDPNLPPSLYGQFDIKPTPDGGKQYVLPHTLLYSVRRAITRPAIVLACSMGGGLASYLAPHGPPFANIIEHSALAALFTLGLLLLLAVPVLLYCLIFSKRAITTITIRPDGLILNDVSFFPAEHIHQIVYGTTFTPKDGRPAWFEPKIEIQVGVSTITLADKLEEQAGVLFERFFRDDTRRYWHRHN